MNEKSPKTVTPGTVLLEISKLLVDFERRLDRLEKILEDLETMEKNKMEQTKGEVKWEELTLEN